MNRFLIRGVFPEKSSFAVISKIVLTAFILFYCEFANAQTWSEVIEGKTFTEGLVIEGKQNVLVRNCQITHPKGDFGIKVQNCKNVRIEHCNVRRVGNEGMSDYMSGSLLPKDSADYPQKRGKYNAKGINIYNCIGVTVSDCEVTDIFGQGIVAGGDDYTKTSGAIIEKCRIAYIYDDAIKFQVKGDQSDGGGEVKLPYMGGIVRDNLIHDIGLGTSQLPFARHGMYLKARDILVEGNVIYNCFYGGAISLRNAGIIRNNKIWNCMGGISYWAQTSTEGSSKTIVIEGNTVRQDYIIDFRMRHISTLAKAPGDGTSNLIQVAYLQNQKTAVIEKFIIRNNTCIANQDYKSDKALIGGFGKPQPGQIIQVENNNLYDGRKTKNYYSNIPLDDKTHMQLVAKWQMDNMEAYVRKVPKWPNDNKYWAWTNGTLYTGMLEMAKMTGDPVYWNFLKEIGEREKWNPGHKIYHADDICVSQMYTGLYQQYKDTAMLNPTLRRLDYIIKNPKSTPLQMGTPGNQDRWSWCDALFMAPPVFARVGNITGDKKYHKFMDKEFWVTYDTLYNHTDSLFFRDTRYKTQKEANGKNVYWSRGNGWVIGGLAIIIDNLPDNHPAKKKYIALYKQMMQRIARLQDEKGFWHPSMLDPASYPMPETSSSAFFTYGLAWGINRGYLDKATYEPIARKGWSALLSAIHPDGKLGWVQQIGADPQKVSFDDTEVYGVGAFLLAGSEITKLKTK